MIKNHKASLKVLFGIATIIACSGLTTLVSFGSEPLDDVRAINANEPEFESRSEVEKLQEAYIKLGYATSAAARTTTGQTSKLQSIQKRLTSFIETSNPQESFRLPGVSSQSNSLASSLLAIEAQLNRRAEGMRAKLCPEIERLENELFSIHHPDARIPASEESSTKFDSIEDILKSLDSFTAKASLDEADTERLANLNQRLVDVNRRLILISSKTLQLCREKGAMQYRLTRLRTDLAAVPGSNSQDGAEGVSNSIHDSAADRILMKIRDAELAASDVDLQLEELGISGSRETSE